MSDTTDDKKKYATHHQIAIVFGIEPRTITKWVNELGMPRAGRGKYNLVACVQWRESYNQKKIEELRAGGKDGLSARKDYFIASAEMKRYQIAEKKKKLIKVSDARRIFEDLFTLIISRKKVYAKKTNPQLEGIQSPGERERILDDNVNELFRDIYERGSAELRRLEKLSGPVEGEPAAPQTVAPHARKRMGRRAPRTKRRNVKRTRRVSRR
jgi:hypothetical protein